MNDYIINFNKELTKFLKYLNTIIPKENNYRILQDIHNDNNNTKYLINFWSNIENNSTLLCEHNEFLFSKEYNLLNEPYILSIYEYNNHESMTIDNKNKLWEYLEFMYLYTYSYKSNIDELNSKLNNMNNELDNKENSETLKSWLAIVDNIKNNKKRIEDSKNMKDDDELEGDNNNFNIPNLNLPKIDKEMFDKFGEYSNQITEGPIGKLAKDIANDIDLNDFSNPTELLSSLCSGNLEDNKLMSLINTVGGKLQNKLNTNDINQEDLMKDASNIVNSFSTMFNNGNNDTNNSNNTNTNKYKNRKQSSTRERLLKKLEEKKNKNNINI